jgi:cytochrome P450
MSELTTQAEQSSARDSSTVTRQKIPPRLHCHALLGSASDMQRDPLGFLRQTRQYGDIVRMRFVFSDAYVIDHPPELKYTHMVFEEALRLYPPAPVFGRKAIADDELGGYPIPANSIILVSPYATQHHLDYWPDPERFDPERFTPERSAGRSHYAYFPFSTGPRMCIGSSYVMMEA